MTYHQRAGSDTPYVLIPYAPYAVDVIHQHLQLPAPAILSGAISPVVPGGNANFQLPVDLVQQPPYNHDLLVFQPCTIMSYINDPDHVQAIVIQPNNIAGGVGSLRRMALFSSAIVPFTGLTIGDIVDATRAIRMQGRPLGMQRPVHGRPSTSDAPPAKKPAGNA